jgi:hypothetical protein
MARGKEWVDQPTFHHSPVHEGKGIQQTGVILYPDHLCAVAGLPDLRQGTTVLKSIDLHFVLLPASQMGGQQGDYLRGG